MDKNSARRCIKSRVSFISLFISTLRVVFYFYFLRFFHLFVGGIFAPRATLNRTMKNVYRSRQREREDRGGGAACGSRLIRDDNTTAINNVTDACPVRPHSLTVFTANYDGVLKNQAWAKSSSMFYVIIFFYNLEKDADATVESGLREV